MMARAAMIALLALGACSRAGLAPAASAAPAPEAFPAETGVPKGEAYPQHIPKRANLPCFRCHDTEQFKTGPPFPHATDEHRSVGHCSVCHASLGHHGVKFDRRPCLGCHDEADLAEKIPNLPADRPAGAPSAAPSSR